MSIEASVQNYLDREGVRYEMITHEHTRDSNHSAQAAHIPGDQLAKCVMLEDSQGYLMAVLPATHKVDLSAVHRRLNRKLGLATDRELAGLFKDCEPGAGARLEHDRSSSNHACKGARTRRPYRAISVGAFRSTKPRRSASAVTRA